MGGQRSEIWKKENDKSYTKFQESIAKTIEKIILKKRYKSVADVGCGPALVIYFLSKRHPSIKFHGFDPYKPIIQKN